MELAPNGKFICQFNPEIECENPECHKCGWNPKVAYHRQKQFREGLGLFEKKYTVPFTGYCEVWAKSAEEAAEKADDIQQQYFAHYDYGEPVCAEEEVEEDE
jgi:hypothetical protein